MADPDLELRRGGGGVFCFACPAGFLRSTQDLPLLLCTSQFQNRPSPTWAIPGHLTRVKLRTVGNLTQNEARPVGHLTFVSKRLSAVGSKRISQFFYSARGPRSRAIALVDSTWVFLLLSFYIVFFMEYAFV